MNKKIIMAFFVPVIFIAGAAIIGLISHIATDCDDCPIEELSEQVMEAQAERFLGLDANTISFDLTPNSDELGPVAMMKIHDSYALRQPDGSWLCKCNCGKQIEMEE